MAMIEKGVRDGFEKLGNFAAPETGGQGIHDFFCLHHYIKCLSIALFFLKEPGMLQTRVSEPLSVAQPGVAVAFLLDGSLHNRYYDAIMTRKVELIDRYFKPPTRSLFWFGPRGRWFKVNLLVTPASP
jgi:hypothetical protein